MDILDTNAYHSLSDNQSNTYGVQRTINEYKEKQQQIRKYKQQQQQQEVLENEPIPDEVLDMSDPLYTNRIDVEPVGITRDPRGPIGLRPVIDPVTGAKSSGRQIYEKVRLINISSRDRIKWICEEIPVDPVTNQYTRLVEDEEGNPIVCRYTSDTLNAEFYWNSIECLNNVTAACVVAGCNPICQLAHENLFSIAEPFFTKDCKIFMKVPKFPNPNNYTILFSSPFSYIKEISLIASEIPNPYRTIGPHNNKIIFHIKEKCGRVLPFRSDYRGIPFYLIELVPGIYSLDQLLREIECLANAALEEHSNPGRADLKFRVCFDPVTEVIKIELKDRNTSRNHENDRSGSGSGSGFGSDRRERARSEDHWVFHWRFWAHWSIPEERTLYRMLGFAKPFLRAKDGSDYYSDVYDNIWRLGTSENSLESANGTPDIRVLEDARGSSKSRSRFCPGRIPRPFAKPNLFPETFFYLIINNLDLGNDAIYACNPDITINNIFAKIQIQPSCCDNGNCVASVNTPNSNRSAQFNNYLFNTGISTNKVYLESPLRTLDRMEIRFVDAFGDPIDFGHLDHSLTFRIVQYIDYLVDSNFDSTRGV